MAAYYLYSHCHYFEVPQVHQEHLCGPSFEYFSAVTIEISVVRPLEHQNLLHLIIFDWIGEKGCFYQ